MIRNSHIPGGKTGYNSPERLSEKFANKKAKGFFYSHKICSQITYFLGKT